MLTETQMAERLELIRAVAQKRDRRAAFKARMKTKSEQNVSWAKLYKKKKKPTQNLTEKYDGVNENHYTDASKYAKEYYGDVAYQTTRFDNDWGDY